LDHCLVDVFPGDEFLVGLSCGTCCCCLASLALGLWGVAHNAVEYLHEVAVFFLPVLELVQETLSEQLDLRHRNFRRHAAGFFTRSDN
jgi:hypothetical protein